MFGSGFLGETWNGQFATGDLDGDGQIDAVVPDGDSHISILFGARGGTFESSSVLAVPQYSSKVAIADFDGDGLADIAVISTQFSLGPGVLRIFLHHGNRSFVAAHDYPTLVNARDIVASDLDADGDVDVAAVNYVGTGGISVFTNDGSAAFSRSDYANGVAADWGSCGIALADLDRDGVPEIITSNRDRSVSILSRSNSGGYTYKVQNITNNACNDAFPIAAGDFNHDGSPDIAVGYLETPYTIGSVAIFANNGTGHLSLQPATSTPPMWALASGDLNGDGLDDLVGPQGLGGMPPAGVLLSQGGWALTAGGQYGFDAQGAVLNDLWGDKKLDLVLNTQAGVAVLDGIGDGTFDRGTELADADAEFKDVDGDGQLDLVAVSSSRLSVRLGRGLGSYTSVFEYPLSNATAVAVDDFDGDGHKDVAITVAPEIPDWQPYQGQVAIFLGDGTGMFSAPSYFDAGPGPHSILSGDVNGDGKPDLVVGGMAMNPGDPNSHPPIGAFAQPMSSVLLNHGNGTFAYLGSGGGWDWISQLADFNGDGILDLFAGPLVLIGAGDGTFGRDSDYFGQYGLGDLNNDCIADFIEIAPDGIIVSLGIGNGTYQPGIRSPGLVQANGPLTVADVNGDGFPDLVSSGGRMMTISYGRGDGTFDHTTRDLLGGDVRSRVVDADGNGFADIVVGPRLLRQRCAD